MTLTSETKWGRPDGVGIRRFFGVWEELLTKYFVCDSRRGFILEFFFKSKMLNLCLKFWEQFGQKDELVLVKLSLHRLMSLEVTRGSGDWDWSMTNIAGDETQGGWLWSLEDTRVWRESETVFEMEEPRSLSSPGLLASGCRWWVSWGIRTGNTFLDGLLLIWEDPEVVWLLERIKEEDDPLLRDDFHLRGVTSLLERISFFWGDTSCQQRTSEDILMMHHGWGNYADTEQRSYIMMGYTHCLVTHTVSAHTWLNCGVEAFLQATLCRHLMNYSQNNHTLGNANFHLSSSWCWHMHCPCRPLHLNKAFMVAESTFTNEWMNKIIILFKR